VSIATLLWTGEAPFVPSTSLVVVVNCVAEAEVGISVCAVEVYDTVEPCGEAVLSTSFAVVIVVNSVGVSISVGAVRYREVIYMTEHIC
jgi:hypothetical protein